MTGSLYLDIPPDCWMLTEGSKHCRLVNYTTGSDYDLSLEVLDNLPDDLLHHLDRGADDLHILFVGCIADIALFQGLNSALAQRFDLPTRCIRVRAALGYRLEGLDGEKTRPFPLRGQVLNQSGEVCHFVIPRPLWVQYRADHAAQQVRRQEVWRVWEAERKTA